MEAALRSHPRGEVYNHREAGCTHPAGVEVHSRPAVEEYSYLAGAGVHSHPVEEEHSRPVGEEHNHPAGAGVRSRPVEEARIHRQLHLEGEGHSYPAEEEHTRHSEVRYSRYHRHLAGEGHSRHLAEERHIHHHRHLRATGCSHHLEAGACSLPAAVCSWWACLRRPVRWAGLGSCRRAGLPVGRAVAG